METNWRDKTRQIDVPCYPKPLGIEDIWEWKDMCVSAKGREFTEHICPCCSRATSNASLSSLGRERLGKMAWRLGCQYTGSFEYNKSQLSEYIIQKICKSLAQLEYCEDWSHKDFYTNRFVLALLNDPDNFISNRDKKISNRDKEE